MFKQMGLGRKWFHQIIYNKLLNFKYSNRKTNKKQKKNEVVEEIKTYLNSEIKRAMKYTQILLLLKLALAKNNYIQKSDW